MEGVDTTQVSRIAVFRRLRDPVSVRPYPIRGKRSRNAQLSELVYPVHRAGAAEAVSSKSAGDA